MASHVLSKPYQCQPDLESLEPAIAMGAVLALCRADEQDDDDVEEEGEVSGGEEGGVETWVCTTASVNMNRAVNSPWTCNRCGATWYRA